VVAENRVSQRLNEPSLAASIQWQIFDDNNRTGSEQVTAAGGFYKIEQLRFTRLGQVGGAACGSED